MIVEAHATATKFEDIPTGTFFMFEREKPEFGIAVSDGSKKAAIILSHVRHGQPVWLALGGLPNDTCIMFPAAVLRPNMSEMSLVRSPHGAVISYQSKQWMRAPVDSGNYYTFDLTTGLRASLPADVSPIYFPVWQVGVSQDEKFEVIFSYPTAA